MIYTAQIVASMGAAVTGAVLRRYLGDGGTILGTAVGSGASTAGVAVYKALPGRTKDKVAPVIVGHARQWTPTTQASSRRAANASRAVARTAASPDRAVPSDGLPGRTSVSRAPGGRVTAWPTPAGTSGG